MIHNVLFVSQPLLRQDDRNLVEEWLSVQGKANRTARFVSTRDELEGVDLSKTDRLLGLFSPERMSFALDVQNGDKPDIEPSLSEMTEVAITMLSKAPQG